MSGQVGSDPGLITQLLILHKNPETNQNHIPDPAFESIYLQSHTVYSKLLHGQERKELS